MSRQNPLPQRPGASSGPSRGSAPRGGRGRGRGGTSQPSSQPAHSAPTASGGYNASGGYPYAGYQQQQQYGAYPGYNAYANASGGYNASAGYNAAYASGGYNAAGGYPGYAAGGYPYTYPGYYAAPTYTAPTPTPAPAPTPPATAWRNCSHPGCNFTGPGETVATHEGDRHLIFPNGKPVERSEEEERYLASLAAGGIKPTIAGTGIALETEEDIAAWIAERKRKWPTRQRVEERKEEEAAASARGENPRKRPRLDPARAAEEWGRDPAPAPSGNMRGGKRGRGGRGGGGDRGGDRGRPATSANAEKLAKEENDVNGKPSTLVAYGSSDLSSDSDSSDSSDSDSDSDEEDSVDEADAKPADPDADPAADADADADAKPEPKETKPDTRPICRFFQRGKCRHGAKCRYRHGDEKGDNKPAEEKKPAGPPKPPAPRQPAQKRANAFARPSMLGALLANPINNTLSQLTQTIRFLVANDMLAGVEVRAGEAEERERERKKVVLVEEVAEPDSIETTETSEPTAA